MIFPKRDIKRCETLSAFAVVFVVVFTGTHTQNFQFSTIAIFELKF